MLRARISRDTVETFLPIRPAIVRNDSFPRSPSAIASRSWRGARPRGAAHRRSQGRPGGVGVRGGARRDVAADGSAHRRRHPRRRRSASRRRWKRGWCRPVDGVDRRTAAPRVTTACTGEREPRAFFQVTVHRGRALAPTGVRAAVVTAETVVHHRIREGARGRAAQVREGACVATMTGASADRLGSMPVGSIGSPPAGSLGGCVRRNVRAEAGHRLQRQLLTVRHCADMELPCARIRVAQGSVPVPRLREENGADTAAVEPRPAFWA